MERAEIKETVSQNFVEVMEQIVKHGKVKNLHQFFLDNDLNPSTFSKIKKGEGNYVTLDWLYLAKNILDVNLNKVFATKGDKHEPLFRDQINSPTVNGDNNTVVGQNGKLNIQGNSGTIGDITVAEKIIQEIPNKKHQAQLRKQMNNMSQEITGLNGQVGDMSLTIEDLKKMIAGYEKQLDEKEREIAFNKKHIETQEKLIKMYEAAKPKKK